MEPERALNLVLTILVIVFLALLILYIADRVTV